MADVMVFDAASAALVIIFMIGCTVFEYLGYAKSMLLMQLFAMLMSIIGIAWAFNVMPEAWYLPMLFAVANLILFVMGVMRGRG